MDLYLNYIVFLGLVYLLYFSFKKNRSIFTPSNFFILIWLFNYSILMFFVRDFYLHFEGSAYILLICSIVFIASNIGMDLNIKKTLNKKNDLYEIIGNFKNIAVICSVIGFTVVPLMVINIKGDFISLFNFKYLQNIAMYVSYLRYKEGYHFPLYVQMFLGLNYFASIINGVYFGYLYLNKNFNNVFKYFIPIFTSILISLITTEKAIILYSSVLFFVSFLVSYNSLGNNEFKISYKNIIIFSSLFILMMLLFTFIQMNRYGFSDYDGFKSVIRKFKIYAFGHISAFSIWFKEYTALKTKNFGFGRYTFAGVFSFLNIYERENGIFTDFSLISDEILFTNVYTAFRGLIVDFTIIGSCIITFIISILAGIAYKNAKRSLISYTYIIVFYCITVFSLFTSLLNYNTIIGSFVLLIITLYFFRFYIYYKKT